MNNFNSESLKNLYVPPSDSHKGQNGKVLLIGGSHLFHASTLWALEIASKIVDMVFFASVPENNEIVQKNKEVFRNGIVVQQKDIEGYIQEAEAILIGPGMNRSESGITINKLQMTNIQSILSLEDEGEQTYYLTKYLLEKYPDKKWIIDAGALQMMDLKDLEKIGKNAILTPHHQEFERVFNLPPTTENVKAMAEKYKCIILLKGESDIVCSPEKCVEISGGNAGMTKGGTGDVLAGLVTALASKNDLFLSACAGSYINKKAGESLFKKVGYYFNSSNLVNEIPVVMKELQIV
jgi:hydroxyethylthiazole kinase-like uncharacterized protein yjeF